MKRVVRVNKNPSLVKIGWWASMCCQDSLYQITSPMQLEYIRKSLQDDLMTWPNAFDAFDYFEAMNRCKWAKEK